MKRSRYLAGPLLLCLTSACAMSVMKPRPITAEIHSHSFPVGECVMISRRVDSGEHFEDRFNNDRASTAHEEQVRSFFNSKKISRVMIVSPQVFRTDEILDLRQLGGAYGCNTVFSYKEKRFPKSSINFMSILYPTLIGMFLVPGNNYQVGVEWEVDLTRVDNGENLYHGKWYGVSPLYHFRPGSFSLITSRAYRNAVAQTVTAGLRQWETSIEKVKGTRP